MNQLIREIKETPDDVLFRNPNNYSNKLNVESDLAELLKDPEYLKRKKIIEAKNIEKSNALKKELQGKKRKLLILQNRRLKDIIPLVNEQDVFSLSYQNPYVENSEDKFEDVKESTYFALIIYLVRYGYIDEFQRLLKKNGFIPSMSDKGDCYDNAATEIKQN